MPLTTKQKTTYILARGLACPYCQSDNIDGETPRIDPERPGEKYHESLAKCGDCGKRWKDLYLLEDIEEL